MNLKSFGFSQFGLALVLFVFGLVAAIDYSQTARNNSELQECTKPNRKLYEVNGLFGVQYICTPVTARIASAKNVK